MTITGSCLCGGVRFEIDRAAGPFELCHCARCRKRSGAAALPMIAVGTSDYRLVSGSDWIREYVAPILYRPPGYRASFCSRCGSPVPDRDPEGDTIEIPAGLLDGDPGIRPDKHIFVELTPPWDSIEGDLPRLTVRELYEQRYGRALPEDFELRRHGSDPVDSS